MAALFPLNWPPAIEVAFAVMSAVSSPVQHLLSPDCELSWMSAARAFYNKQLGFGLMPIGVVVICFTYWIAVFRVHACVHARATKRARIREQKRTEAAAAAATAAGVKLTDEQVMALEVSDVFDLSF